MPQLFALALISLFISATSHAGPPLIRPLAACVGPALNDGLDDAASPAAAHADLGVRIGQARLLGKISAEIDFESHKTIPLELKRIARDGLGSTPDAEMTGTQFNVVFDGLKSFASRYEIEFTQVTDTLGVFPKGLKEVGLSGFGRTHVSTAPAGFARRHELAHLFHVVLIRAVIIEHLGRSPEPPSTAQMAEVNDFLGTIEAGGNYYEFEKAVTAMSSPLHTALGSGARANSLYLSRLDQLVDATYAGFQAGKIRFPNGMRIEEVYALALSRAPIILGTSIGQLGMRLPFLFLAVAYAANLDVTQYGIKPFPEDDREEKRGFRPWVHSLIRTQAERVGGAQR